MSAAQTSSSAVIRCQWCPRPRHDYSLQLTRDIMRSSLVPRLFLNTMSGLLSTTRSSNLRSDRLTLPSAGPLAPNVFSDTFGTCCLKTSGVILPRPRRCPDPRPGPHVSTPTTHTVASIIDTRPARSSILR